jgi:hypothetical protein
MSHGGNENVSRTIYNGAVSLGQLIVRGSLKTIYTFFIGYGFFGCCWCHQWIKENHLMEEEFIRNGNH